MAKAVLLSAIVAGVTYATWRRHSHTKKGTKARVMPRGRPLQPAVEDEFSIVTYNVLSDCFATRNKHPHVFPKYLEWDYRWGLLQRELAAFGADIICLQEVELARWEEYQAYMASLGYEGILQDRSKEGSKIGNAIFYRPEKFTVVWVEQRTRVLIAALQWNLDPPPETKKVTYVLNVHLEGNPYRPSDRVNQMKNALARLEARLGDRQAAEHSSLVICGDFNSGSDGAVYHLLFRGHLEGGFTEAYMPDAPVTDVTVSHPFALQDAYHTARATPPYTRNVPHSASVMDFIWCSRHLAVSTVMRPMPLDHRLMLASTHLPNRLYPSDHLPIAAIIKQGS